MGLSKTKTDLNLNLITFVNSCRSHEIPEHCIIDFLWIYNADY